MRTVIPVLNYSTFYSGHEPPKVPLELLDGYDLEMVILSIVGMRNSIYKVKYDHSRDGAIQTIIAALPAHRAELLKLFMCGEHRFSLVQPAVVDKILLDLFLKLKDYSISRALNDGQYEQRLLDVLLSYNETFYDNDIVDRLEKSHELIWTLVMMQGVSRVSKADFARTGLIKHLLMLAFLRESLGEKFIGLQRSLWDNAGMNSIYHFIITFRHLFDFLESNQALVPRMHPENLALRYLEQLGLVITRQVAAAEKFDIGAMLSRPFFKTSSGAVFILDHSNFAFLVERAFMFLLYHKSSFPKLAGFKNINGLFSHFGKAYYEEFLMGKLLKSLQGRYTRVLASDDLHLADFTLVLEEKDVFVIEVKSFALNYRVFDAQNADEFREYIDEHYIQKTGTPQLEQYIAYLKDDAHHLINLRNAPKDLNIYPILILTDPKAATYGVNDYVAQQTAHSFSKFSSDFKTVMPLTMIQSDFFVENISLLAKDKNMLRNLIKEYHFQIKRNKERFKKDGSVQSFIRSMISFDQFAIGKHGAYRLSQNQIHYHLEDLFGLKTDNPEN